MGEVDPDWEGFLKNHSLRVYKKGQIILFQGEAPRYVYIVQRGVVKTYNIDYDGREQFINLENSHNAFPKLWIWGRDLKSQYYYEALSDCYLYTIPRDEYITFVKSNIRYLMKELDSVLADYEGSSLRLNALLYTRASDKVAHIFHYLIEDHSAPTKDNIVTLNLKLTHQNLASLTGLTRETVSNELSKLKAQGVISYRPSQYKINLKKLNDVLRKEF